MNEKLVKEIKFQIQKTNEYKNFYRKLPDFCHEGDSPILLFVLFSYAFNCGSISRKEYYDRHKHLLKIFNISESFDLLSEEQMNKIVGHKFEQRDFIMIVANEEEVDNFLNSFMLKRPDSEDKDALDEYKLMRKVWLDIGSLCISYTWE